MTPTTTQQHKVLSDILSTNAQWAKDVELAEPGFFFNSTKGQSPKVPFFFLVFSWSNLIRINSDFMDWLCRF